MEKRKDLYKDGRLNLVYIAGGKLNLNASMAGTLRRYMADMERDINGLAMSVCVKEGSTNPNRVEDRVRVIDAIQGQRLREVKAEDVKKVFSAIGLKREDYLCLPLVEMWRNVLVEEMTKEGYNDFSDEAIEKYMANRILEDICKQ